MSQKKLAICLFMVVVFYGWRASFAADPASTYVLDYPTAERFVPPVEGFFDEIASTVGRVGRRTFRHQPNGGYGLAIRDRVGAQHLIHLGADVGWYRVGDPVVSAADGIVRVAQQPLLKERNRKDKEKSPQTQPPVMQWGGVIAIEHHLPDDSYVTTVYGHLDTKLLVSRGDIVKAGQPIGTIGKTRVNGGYKPHLHFGVRSGRMVEKGREFLPVNINGQTAMLKIEGVTEKVVTLSGAKDLPDQFQVILEGKTFDIRKKDGSAEVSADILWHIQPVGFAIVGYGLSIEGWRDPVAFLQNPQAE